jgi:hypothetical protein
MSLTCLSVLVGSHDGSPRAIGCRDYPERLGGLPYEEKMRGRWPTA